MKDTPQKEFARLPTNVVPVNYAISLKPNFKTLTFAGNESIKVNVNAETSTILLNALDLEISSAQFTSHSGQTQTANKIEISADDETAAIEFESSLEKGTGSLQVSFTGSLNDKMKGFYRSKYTSVDGQEERYAAVTQFEPTDARRAFPCWDEPSVKATFDITLIVPKQSTALSNMNVISDVPLSEDADNSREVKFATSPVMSTYLVAFVVGEYDFVEDTSSDGVKVRVYTPVGKKEQGMFALEVAIKTLPFYKDYFAIAYPLPKLDLITIADFASGAMENWGLVTYRESCLLVDDQNTSAMAKQYIALVVAHELAHQWFGNLVTMEWWTHLWLNEGFASFIEFLAVDYLFSEYKIWSQFVSTSHSEALVLDALNNSHAIEVEVGHPSEIDEIFDDISYNKGASVIRMLHSYIGDDLFRKGMNLYLSRHSYKNTITEDLWSALEEASNKPIRAVMSTWTKQKGFPVISANARQDGDTRIINLSQEKFSANGKLEPSDSNLIWMIPTTVSTSQKEKVVDVLMNNQTLEISVPNIKSDEWVKLNPGTVGVYRVQYSSEMLNLLLSAVHNKTLPPLDRFGLQNDLFAMVLSGRSSTVDILKLLDAFSNEDNYTVWCSINDSLGRLNVLLSHTDSYALFHSFGRQLLSNIYSRLGWEPIKEETHLDTLLRSLVINRLAVFEDKEVIARSNKLFESHCNGTYVIPADLRGAVYRAVAIGCDDKSFDQLFSLYRKADLQEEKNRILRALGNVKQIDRIQKVLDFSMSSEVRNQDSTLGIISVAFTKEGRDLAWNFFKQNKDELRRRYGGIFLISHLVKCVTENFASEERAQEVESFFEQNRFPAAERTVKQSLETIRLNAQWLARDSDSIHAYLSSRSQSQP